MAAALKDVFPVIRPLWAMDARIRFHTQHLQMLHGLKYDPAGTMKLKGKKDFPCLQWLSINEEEDLTVGGAKAGGFGGAGTRRDVYTVRYELQVWKDYGPFRIDPLGANAENYGLCEWSALIRDALQTRENGEVDTEMVESGQRLLTRPMIFSVEDAGLEQISWAATIKVELHTALYAPGKRTCLSP